MDAPQYLNLSEFAYWPITKQISWWFCFYVNWTHQWALYHACLPFLPGCEFGAKCFLKRRLGVVGQECCVIMQTGWEKRCPGWACLSKHPGLQLAEMLVLSYCVQKLLIVLCGRSSVVSASPDKAEGWDWEVLTWGRHKADLPSYPPPERKDCLSFVFWLVCIRGTCNNTHRVNPLSDTCCCLI